MSDKKYFFETEEKFTEDVSYLCPNAYSEVLKFKSFFEKNISHHGENSFSPTMSFFSANKTFIGVITCREASDKEDLYQALAEMLFLPMSVKSDLFVLATDISISTCTDKNDKVIEGVTDALMISFVSAYGCAIYILPYKVEGNNLAWYDSASYFTKIAIDVTEVTGDVYTGDLIELFYTFSSSENSGAFNPEEVIHFLNNNGFICKIFNPEALNDKYHLIPFR